MSSLSFVFLGLITLAIIIGSDAQRGRRRRPDSSESVSISIDISESIDESSDESDSGNQRGAGNRGRRQQGGGNREFNQRGGGRRGQAQHGGGGGGGGNGQDTFKFSSLSKMPKSMLSKLSNSQIEKLKKQGKTGNPSNLNRKSPGTQHGGGGKGQDTMQFSSLSKMPKNMLDKLSNSQIENLKKHGKSGNPSDISPPKHTKTASPIDNMVKKTVGADGIPTFTYTSFSQLSFSDESSDSSEDFGTVEETTISSPESSVESSPESSEESSEESSPESSEESSPESSVESSPESSEENSSESSPESSDENSPESIPETTPTPSTQPGTTGPQTFQYSSYSQIPKDILDNLSDDQKENIKKMLSGQMKPETMKVPGGIPEGNNGKPLIKGFEFHNFKDLPNSFNFPFPGVNNSLANDLVNTIFNYVSVGGQLTGIPPIDLLLLRFYLHQGPQNYCGSHTI